MVGLWKVIFSLLPHIWQRAFIFWKVEWCRCESGVGLFLSVVVRFWSRLRSIITVQSYEPTETSDVMEKDIFYEQLHAIQGKLST